MAYDKKQAHAATLAEKEKVDMWEKTKVITENRKKKQDERDRRLNEAAGRLHDRINGYKQRLADRADFYKVVHAERAQRAMERKTEHDLEIEDKIDNVNRIRRLEDFHLLNLKRKQDKEDGRYEQILDEKLNLLYARKKSQHSAMMRKHKLKEAMEYMKVTNKFLDLDEILGIKKKKGKAEDKEENMSPRPGTGNAAAV